MSVDRHPTWRVLFDLIRQIGQTYHGSIYDYTTCHSWDPGQAVCREAYGPEWMGNPEFQVADERPDSEPAPEEAVAAAKRILAEEPSWAVESAQKEVKHDA
jgi:hypothetical protein